MLSAGNPGEQYEEDVNALFQFGINAKVADRYFPLEFSSAASICVRLAIFFAHAADRGQQRYSFVGVLRLKFFAKGSKKTPRKKPFCKGLVVYLKRLRVVVPT